MLQYVCKGAAAIAVAPALLLLSVAPAARADDANPAGVVIESFEWLAPKPTYQQIPQAINNQGDHAGVARVGTTTTGIYIQIGDQDQRYSGPSGATLVAGMNDRNQVIAGFGGVYVLRNGFDASITADAGAVYRGINNEGVIVGHFADSHPTDASKGFRLGADFETTVLETDFFPEGIDAQGRIFGLTRGFVGGFQVKDGDEPIETIGTFGGTTFRISHVTENGNMSGFINVEDDSFSPIFAYAYINGQSHVFESQGPQPYARAHGVTSDGQVIGIDLDSPATNNSIWIRRDGARSNLREVLAPTLGYTPVLTNVSAVSDGGWIIGFGTPPGETTLRPYKCKIRVGFDTDGDGLLDDWEINGIPYVDINGQTQRYMLPGADPMRKDLYVEVDGGTILLPKAAINKVVAAFANAPVKNPDGSTGITLHVIKDEFNLLLPNSVVIGKNFPENFAEMRAQRFGTEAERADPSAEALLEAKAKAFRYCLVYDGLEFIGNESVTPPYAGLGEVGGSNFVMDLAQPVFKTGKRTLDSKAAVFMHELGHCLGLEHGGGDKVQGKPNYPSIMNYALSHPLRWNRRFWRLDYSREKLATIDESSINEAKGINSKKYRKFSMPYGVGSETNRRYRLVRLMGRGTDFNNDGNRFGANVAADLNFIGPGAKVLNVGSPSPGETLEGHDDWANIVLAITPRTPGRSFELPEGCPSQGMVDFLEATMPEPCDGDIDGDGVVDATDLALLLTAWGEFPDLDECDLDLNGDGRVDGADLGVLLGFWGVCADGSAPLRDARPGRE